MNSDKRTQIFDRAGKHIVTVTSANLGSSWHELYGVAVDAQGRLLLCSQGTKSLLRVL